MKINFSNHNRVIFVFSKKSYSRKTRLITTSATTPTAAATTTTTSTKKATAAAVTTTAKAKQAVIKQSFEQLNQNQSKKLSVGNFSTCLD